VNLAITSSFIMSLPITANSVALWSVVPVGRALGG
jgi:hypothetical protein